LRKEEETKADIVWTNQKTDEKRNATLFTFAEIIIQMYYNQSTFVNFNGHAQIFFPCVHTIWSRLLVHFCYTWFVTIFILFIPAVSLSILGDYLWTYRRRADQPNEELFPIEREHSRLDALDQCLVEEVRLIFIYVFAAFVFTFLMTSDSVNCLTLFRWMIEASYIPFLFFLDVLCAYFDTWVVSCFSVPEVRSASLLGFILKGSSFVWMRYTELYPSSTLNDFQTFVFYSYCGTSNHHHVPADCGLHRLLPPV
jgi:hypothetical protein